MQASNLPGSVVGKSYWDNYDYPEDRVTPLATKRLNRLFSDDSAVSSAPISGLVPTCSRLSKLFSTKKTENGFSHVIRCDEEAMQALIAELDTLGSEIESTKHGVPVAEDKPSPMLAALFSAENEDQEHFSPIVDYYRPLPEYYVSPPKKILHMHREKVTFARNEAPWFTRESARLRSRMIDLQDESIEGAEFDFWDSADLGRISHLENESEENNFEPTGEECESDDEEGKEEYSPRCSPESSEVVIEDMVKRFPDPVPIGD